MAVAVDFRKYAPEDSRGDLMRRIEDAPVEHAQAVLAAYDLLERLHEKGILDLLIGLLSAGDTVVNQVVNAVSTPEAVAALRAGLIFGGLLKSVDANRLHEIFAEAGGQPPSLLSLARQAGSENSRRGLALVFKLLDLFGEALKESQLGDAATKKAQ
jgi:uncharacterized protein YjgD (DUF1641 family)